MTDAIEWADGERERFRASLLPDEMSFYVDKNVLASYRDEPKQVPDDRWRELIAKGGYHVNVLIAYGPPAIGVEAIQGRLDKDAKTIWPLDGALAVLGEAVIPTAIRTLERAISNIGQGVYANQIQQALADVAPIRSVRVAELVIEVLASSAKPKVKAMARAWLARHAATAAPAIERATASSDPKTRTAGKAAAKAVAGT